MVFPSFQPKGCFLLPLYLTNIKQQISNFPYLLLCARAIIRKFGIFLLKGRVVGIIWIKWPFYEVLAMVIILQLSIGFCIFLWWLTSSLTQKNCVCPLLYYYGLFMIYLENVSLLFYIYFPYLKGWAEVFFIFLVGLWWF